MFTGSLAVFSNFSDTEQKKQWKGVESVLTLKTSVCETFGITYPIIQAGMAGGATTPELVAAVSEAGGLGTLGAAYMTPEQVEAAAETIRSLTDQPFAVNFFAATPPDDYTNLAEVQQVLRLFHAELDIAEPQAPSQTADFSSAIFGLCVDLRVPVISTAFGCLTTEQMRKAKAHGIRTTAMVTTVGEALEAEHAGVDAIVAQGSEAGGHRSMFSFDDTPAGTQIGLFSLVPQIADAVKIPVIAAGGITDGRGLIAALALGAEGVQLGTRFLVAAEAGTHTVHKQAIFDSGDDSTVVTRSFSGRPARGIKNRFIEEFEKSGTSPLPFPSQNTVTKELRLAAAKNGNADFLSLWAGQSAGMLKEEGTAETIVQSLVAEAEKLI